MNSPEESKRRYRRLIRRAFPDLHGTIEDEVVEGFNQVGRVVDMLSLLQQIGG